MINWVANYRDGTSLEQLPEGLPESKYTDIDRSKLASFSLFRGKKTLITFHFDFPGQILLYRRRVFKSPGKADKVFHLVGWMMGEVNSVSILTEDGPDISIEVISKWRSEALFAPIEPLECETMKE